jgi:RNA polymerase sigma-70 factor (ECF subfamily)
VSDGHYIQQRLIRAARTGDHEAFRMLTEPWIAELRRHCARILGNPHDAEDAVQETLIKAWRKLDTYSASGPMRAWLYTIAANTSLNMRKSRRRDDVADDAEATAERVGPGLDEGLEAHEDVELVFMSVVSGLPARQRAAVILRDGLGWSALEIAQLLNATMPSVNSALQRARAALAPPGDAECPRLDDLHQALFSAYVAAWDQTDIEGLVSIARADAARTTLIQRLQPVGGGWIRLPATAAGAEGEPAIRPAFMNT